MSGRGTWPTPNVFEFTADEHAMLLRAADILDEHMTRARTSLAQQIRNVTDVETVCHADYQPGAATIAELPDSVRTRYNL